DLSGGINALPPLGGKEDEAQNEALARTGTAGAAPAGCTKVAHTPVRPLRLVASEGNEESAATTGGQATQLDALPTLGSRCHLRAAEGGEEAPPGFEPGMADLQSAAFPLGEGATLCAHLSGVAERGQSRPARPETPIEFALPPLRLHNQSSD